MRVTIEPLEIVPVLVRVRAGKGMKFYLGLGFVRCGTASNEG